MLARPVARGVWRLPFESSTLPPFDHTNGWLVVDGATAVLIDPGFRDRAGLEMLQGALDGARARNVAAVWLTHTHNDHCEGLPAMRRAWPDAEVLVHAAEIDRLDVAHRVRAVADGAELAVGARPATVLHTPGHSPGHLAFVLPDVGWIFAGDLLAGHGSVWIGAPEGDVAAYLASLERLRRERPKVVAPGHGEPRLDADAAIRDAFDHRLQREAQVLAAVRRAAVPLAADEIRAVVYPGLDPGLGALAERTVAAHLDKLVAEGRVVRSGPPSRPVYAAER